MPFTFKNMSKYLTHNVSLNQKVVYGTKWTVLYKETVSVQREIILDIFVTFFWFFKKGSYKGKLV